jgi:hypothetical protein
VNQSIVHPDQCFVPKEAATVENGWTAVIQVEVGEVTVIVVRGGHFLADVVGVDDAPFCHISDGIGKWAGGIFAMMEHREVAGAQDDGIS